ncbi:MAG: hypothetical protein JWN93_2402 [Hyphomicrobiales bacterium]|nr:hypothetical protein [Hyphomicrobiales bacterium]
MKTALACFVALLLCTGAVRANESASTLDVDTEHLFGFTEGTDLGEKGEVELELGAFWRNGARAGRYNAVTGSAELKASLSDNLRVAPGVFFSRHAISSVPGLPNVNSAGLEGVSLELKYRVLDRTKSPFGLTFAVIPAFARLDEREGARTRDAGVAFLMAVDRELVENRLYAAANLVYEPSVSRTPGSPDGWRASSAASASAALSARVAGQFYLGGEVRYQYAANGAFFNGGAGHGLFVGPTLFARLSPKLFVAAGWNRQVSGRAEGVPGRLDLDNFSRNEARLRVGYAF